MNTVRKFAFAVVLAFIATFGFTSAAQATEVQPATPVVKVVKAYKKNGPAVVSFTNIDATLPVKFKVWITYNKKFKRNFVVQPGQTRTIKIPSKYDGNYESYGLGGAFIYGAPINASRGAQG